MVASLGIAQNSVIENVRLRLSITNDSLIVTYDLTDNMQASDIKLEVTTEEGIPVQVRSVSGDIGNFITPGNDKTIVWNIAADSIDVFGSRLLVQVTCDVPVTLTKIKEKTWVPWFYIAAGASTATGVFAHFNVKNIYTAQYLTANTTPDAALYNSRVSTWETVRDVAFGAAGILGTIGVVVHVKHRQEVRSLSLNYYPCRNGAEFALTYNF